MKKADDVAEVNDKFLMCRVKGHRWEHLTDEITRGDKRKVREVTRFWTCYGCSTEVQEVIELPTFEIVARRYHYPDGYQFDTKAMGGRVFRPEVRREQFRRLGWKF